MKRLIYFTNSFPFGIGEQWKSNELKELVHHFEEIIILPDSYGGNKSRPVKVPEKIVVKPPFFESNTVSIPRWHLLPIIFNKRVFSFLKEFFRKKVFLNKGRYISWVTSTITIIRLCKSKVLQEILSQDPRHTILYFYWGRGTSEMLPYINTSRFLKTFVRMHRYDLFEHNDNYIPYRSEMLNHISVAAPSSQAGKVHLMELYPKAKADIQVFRCGTIGNGKIAQPSRNGTLQVVSCSLLSAVKRVHLIIECLKYIDFPILWRHIGSGPLREELEELVKKEGVQDKFIFEGMMDSNKILDFYTDNTFDLFVNVSSSEGVPFSIMEAFSVGIPVMATNVGGTGEIVDDTVGKLLTADLDPKELADKLKEFYLLNEEKKSAIRKNAYQKYQDVCDAEKLAKELTHLLKS